MLIEALVLLAVVLALLAVGLHLGVHSTIAAGAVGLVSSGVFLVYSLSQNRMNISAITAVVLLASLLLAVASIVMGTRSFIQLRRNSESKMPLEIWNQTGVALSDLAPSGTVQIAGETWSAESVGDAIAKGSTIFVVEVDKLHIRVAEDPFGEKAQPAGG